MRSKVLVAGGASLLLAACGGWKSGQANSAQGNISKDSRPPATGKASVVTNAAATNGMVMLALASVKGTEAVRIMHARQEGMKTLGEATKAVHRALAGTPDLATVRSNGATIARLSEQASGWFPLGTGAEAGKTRAKPDIWQNADDFATKLRNFQASARAFSVAASSGDAAAMNARFSDLGGTCKACHDKYRAEEQH
jgi:cytochrome c556